MGGNGSGSWYRWNSKVTTESQKRLDIRWLRKNGYLKPGNIGTLSWSFRGELTGSIGFSVGTDQMVLKYRHREHGGDWISVEQAIDLERTLCNYGGYRSWFICPRCLRRFAVLYGPGKYFYCRHCYGLTYSSQQKNRVDRLMHKARKIHLRLGGDGNLLDSFPGKPKFMHRQTYGRLKNQAKDAKNLAFIDIGHRWGNRF